jgi:hypothetical protein
MRNNKILATAMTTALAGALSAGGVNAGALTVTYPDGTPVISGNARSVANEVITPNQIIPSNCTSGTTELSVNYITDNAFTQNTQVTFQLLEGTDLATTAVFLTNSSATTTSASDVSPSALSVTGSTTSTPIALVGGGEGTNTLTFLLQATGNEIPAQSTLQFSFCISKADILEEAGQSLGVKVDFSSTKYISEPGGTITVVNGQPGAEGDINAGLDDGDVKVDVGGEAGAKKFTGSSIDQTNQLSAILGEVCLSGNSNVSVYDATVVPPVWALNETTLMDGSTFTIIDAPLNASIGHTVPTDYATNPAADLSQVMVFFDFDGDGIFDATDVPASTVDTTTASFTDLTAAEMAAIVSATTGTTGASANGCVNVVIKASGNDEIKTHDVAPTGTLRVVFSTGATSEFTGKMNHIKRSGTVCVLYNIPGPNSIENANIRVTNKSATPDGTLIGTLRLPDGTEIFTDYDILTATGLGLIGANQTMYLNTDMLNTIAQSASNPNGAWTDGWTRAILRLETNLNTVEMMALIRDDDVMGAPLMNMSTGASGNGCGR